MNKKITALILVLAMAIAIAVTAYSIGASKSAGQVEFLKAEKAALSRQLGGVIVENDQLYDKLKSAESDIEDLSVKFNSLTADVENTGWWFDDNTRYMTECFAEELEFVPWQLWGEDEPVTINRDGRMVVMYGDAYVVDSEAGEAYFLNEDGSLSDSYTNVSHDEVSDGDIVRVYLLANPATDYFDDFIARWDRY